MSPDLIITLITSILGGGTIGSVISHLMTKSKYKTEVSASEIANLKEAFEVSKLVMEDNRTSLLKYIGEVTTLKEKLARIEGAFMRVIVDTCSIKACPNRLRYDEAEIDKIKDGTELDQIGKNR